MDWESAGGMVHIFSADGIDRLDGRLSGFYTYEECYSFRAGSYSGYNQWREWLCKWSFGVDPQIIWTAPNEYAGRWFFELIDFSDCEGAIGPETSSKLARDFAENEARIQASAIMYESHELEKYKAWKEAFELASDSGFVIFH